MSIRDDLNETRGNMLELTRRIFADEIATEPAFNVTRAANAVVNSAALILKHGSAEGLRGGEARAKVEAVR